jgi:hypothetical protein
MLSSLSSTIITVFDIADLFEIKRLSRRAQPQINATG